MIRKRDGGFINHCFANNVFGLIFFFFNIIILRVSDNHRYIDT